MNVKELIQSAPQFELIDDFLSIMDIPPERTEAAKERFGEFLDRFDGIEPTSTGYVILGVVYVENVWRPTCTARASCRDLLKSWARSRNLMQTATQSGCAMR